MPIPAIPISYERDVELTPDSTLNVSNILLIIYCIGIAILTFRNISLYYNLSKILKTGVKTRSTKYKLIDSTAVKSPFSVLNYILVNTQSLSETEKNLILEHEITHIHQKHWFDLLCSECMLLLQWFNPFVWIYVMLQKENHEFLADKAVIDKGTSPALYQAVLINQQFKGPVFSFSNSFNYSNHLNRLTMIKKGKSSPWKRAAALAIIPVLGIFFWASAKPNYVIDNVPENNGIKDSINEKISVSYFSGNDSIVIVNGEEMTIAELKKMDSKDISDIKIKKEKGNTTILVKSKSGSNGVVMTNSPARINKDSVLVIGYHSNKDKLDISGLKGGKPLFIIDGKKSQEKDMDKLNPDLIDNISILKDKSATEKYGKDGNNGVIIIQTKEYTKKIGQSETDINKVGSYTIVDYEKSIKGKAKDAAISVTTLKSEKDGKVTMQNGDVTLTAETILIVDDVEKPYKLLESMNPSNIESFTILKDDAAIKKYGERAKDGVVIVNTQQKKKQSPPPPPPLPKKPYTITDKTLIIIDGKKSTFEEYSKVVKNRKSMKVLTGEEAIKEYGDEGKNGVAVIWTKDAPDRHITIEVVSDKKNE